MKSKIKDLPLLFAFFMIVATYISIIILVIIDKIKWFDQPIITFFRTIENPITTEVMRFFTFIGNREAVIVIAVFIAIIMLIIFKFKSEVLFFSLTLIGSDLLNKALKFIIERDRPIEYRLIEVDGYSFPSGHAMASFTMYVTLTYLIWRNLKTKTQKLLIIFITAIIVFLIGTSRIYLGVHYPSDVLGGYLTSAIWVFFSILIYRKFKKI